MTTKHTKSNKLLYYILPGTLFSILFVVFSLIVLAWQFASFDSLQDWEFSRAAQKRIVAVTERIAGDLPREPKQRRDPKHRDAVTA